MFCFFYESIYALIMWLKLNFELEGKTILQMFNEAQKR